MADNCGICLALDDKYGCGWCQSSNRCEVKEQCEFGKGVWLDRSKTCPNPQVQDFYPKFGPFEGGTNVTIRGINLGKDYKDIIAGITVAGMPCLPYEELYVQTRQITCKVDGPGNKSGRDVGKVIVRVKGDYRGESVEKFAFVNPQITAISPQFGPQSGGTLLTIHGEYMNAGSFIKARIDDLPCRITQ